MMGSVPWQLLLVGALLDLTLLVLAAMGVRVAWRHYPRRKPRPLPPPPERVLTPEQMLEALSGENRENRRRLAWLRAKTANMQRFLGFPAD